MFQIYFLIQKQSSCGLLEVFQSVLVFMTATAFGADHKNKSFEYILNTNFFWDLLQFAFQLQDNKKQHQAVFFLSCKHIFFLHTKKPLFSKLPKIPCHLPNSLYLYQHLVISPVIILLLSSSHLPSFRSDHLKQVFHFLYPIYVIF